MLIRIRGFSNTCGNWFKQVIKGGTVCVVNLMTALTLILQVQKKLKQEGHIHPILYNFYTIFVDVLTIMVLMSEDSGIIGMF